MDIRLHLKEKNLCQGAQVDHKLQLPMNTNFHLKLQQQYEPCHKQFLSLYMILKLKWVLALVNRDSHLHPLALAVYQDALINHIRHHPKNIVFRQHLKQLYERPHRKFKLYLHFQAALQFKE